MAITRDQVEYAIDFFILMESTPRDYDQLKIHNRAVIAQHNATIKQFGMEISPLTLENMQDVFYSFTNSTKYLRSRVACSVARTVLSSNWHGIGDWLD
jgi:hypothetical protein